MKAVVFKEFGEPSSVLQLEDIEEPTPGQGEVLVSVIASPINPSDLMYVRGVYGRRPELPATPGFEGVGIVESSGGGWYAKSMHGKRVVVLNRQQGNWSEKTVIPAKQAIPVSIGLTDKQAATFFVNPMTAWVMVREVLKVPRRQWLLQTAANSTLGRMVASLGRRFNFRTINIVRRPEQAAEIESVDSRAIVFDADKDDPQDLIKQVRQVLRKDQLKYIIDPVGGRTGSALIGCLGRGGRMLSYGTLADDPTLQFSPRTLMTSGASIEGFWLSNYMAKLKLPAKVRLIKKVTKHIENGTLSSPIASTWMLNDFKTALQHAEAPANNGKVLIKMG